MTKKDKIIVSLQKNNSLIMKLFNKKAQVSTNFIQKLNEFQNKDLGIHIAKEELFQLLQNIKYELNNQKESSLYANKLEDIEDILSPLVNDISKIQFTLNTLYEYIDEVPTIK